MATVPKYTYRAPWDTPVLDWELDRDGDWTRSAKPPRSGALVVARINRADWNRASVWGEDLGPFRCPDAAREAADKRIVILGRLDESHAFKRLGDWQWDERSKMWMRYSSEDAGPTCGGKRFTCALEDGSPNREESDRASVARGALDPSRAFKRTADAAPPPR